ncbi:MAG TPA: thioredoxin family protein [Nitrososphaeraceae archaeon]|nr:thioredoxin family protein [Nitrososphaeraceae archaeon]
MNRDNISAVVMAVAIVSVIAGFAIYFNTQGSNISSKSTSTDEFIPIIGQIDKNGKMINIDKSQFKKAKNFTKISEYINTKPISLDNLKDKVVLVDFWTYSCINCIRTIPYLNEWYDKYSDKGFVIVGIHTPEFEFEKNSDNVKSAVQKFGIKYPVLQDNDKETWNEYENRYWPRKYLIDDEGYIRYDHIGEGAYSETEKVIQALLTERAAHLGIKNINFNQSQNVDSESRLESQEVNFSKIQSPELYFGYEFARSPLGNIEDFKPNQIVSYNLLENSEIKPNQIYLEGKWKNNPDHMELQSNNGSIILKYNSKSVNIVAGGNGNFTVIQDGKLITNDLSRDASSDGIFMIDKQRLYNLVTNKDYGEHTIEIDVKGQGFQIYTFTFG